MAEQEQTPQDAPQAPPTPPAPNGYTCTLFRSIKVERETLDPLMQSLIHVGIAVCVPNP